MDNNLCTIINLKRIVDPRGNLTVAEEGNDLPFHIERAYWIYDVPGGECRGGHAHRQCKELIIALSGSFTITVDNGRERQTYLLNHPWQGLLVDTSIWRTLDDFSSGAVCLVLASQRYDEADYIRSYDEFMAYASQKGGPSCSQGEPSHSKDKSSHSQ